MQVVEIGGSTTSEVSLSPRTAEVDGLEAQQRPSSLLISSDEDRRDVTAPLSWNQGATPPGGWEEYLGSPVLSIGADHFPGEREEELVFFSQGIRPVEGQGAREAREEERRRINSLVCAFEIRSIRAQCAFLEKASLCAHNTYLGGILLYAALGVTAVSLSVNNDRQENPSFGAVIADVSVSFCQMLISAAVFPVFLCAGGERFSVDDPVRLGTAKVISGINFLWMTAKIVCWAGMVFSEEDKNRGYYQLAGIFASGGLGVNGTIAMLLCYLRFLASEKKKEIERDRLNQELKDLRQDRSAGARLARNVLQPIGPGGSAHATDEDEDEDEDQ
ncbi:hypothetical protein OAN22_00820 [Alphaproteobacteria bacterium]|nr:hypothetical protein [Alphaproteobacteria bacterium]